MQPVRSQNLELTQPNDVARRDDLTWTQYITNLAANKLAPPKSQTLKVLEDHLLRLNEELGARGEARLKERVPGDPTATREGEQPKTETERETATAKTGLAVGLNEMLAANRDNGATQAAPSMIVGTASIDKFAFSELKGSVRPGAEVQRLHNEITQGSRWIDVLWQFISAHQKKVTDLERLGIEPSERVDLQVDMIRQVAASYDKLSMLTRLPDSLSEARECKVTDDIRTMALVYVARKMMDVASPDEIAGAGDNQKKPKVEFPRSVIKPFEGIKKIEFDPMDLILAA